MASFKDIKGNRLTKVIYSSLSILLIFLFIDTPVHYIKHRDIFSVNSGLLHGIAIFTAFLVVRKMIAINGIKKTAIIIFSAVFIINMAIAIINFIPVDELREYTETQTETDTETQTQTQTELTSDTTAEVEEKDTSTKEEDEHSEGPVETSLNFILKYSWLFNFILLLIISYGLYFYFRHKHSPVNNIVEEIVEPAIIEEIKVDKITTDTYEQGVYLIYRQLCEIAKSSNGITRKKSMSSTEYGELLIKLDFPEQDITNIIHAFEALRYGAIKVSNKQVDELNDALNNINTAIKQHD